MEIKQVIAKIKEKKEFNSIEDRFVRTELIKYLKQDKKALQAIQEGRIRSEDYKNAFLCALNRAGKHIIDNLARTWQERDITVTG